METLVVALLALLIPALPVPVVLSVTRALPVTLLPSTPVVLSLLTPLLSPLALLLLSATLLAASAAASLVVLLMQSTLLVVLLTLLVVPIPRVALLVVLAAHLLARSVRRVVAP